jgi:hypothetical protein
MYKLYLGANRIDMSLNCFKSNILNLFILGCISIIAISCNKTENQTVPNIPVYIELNLNDELVEMGVGMVVTIVPDTINKSYSIIDYNDNKHKLRRISWKTYGNGLILYRRDFYVYQVFDRTCTYKAFEEYCKLQLGTNFLVPICPCCKSEFILTADGTPSNTSKATKLLMQYNAVVTNNNTRLILSNKN